MAICLADADIHYSDVEWTTDTDKTFSTGFLGGCLEAGPNRCALARANATVSDLEETVFGLIDTLKFNPIAIGGVLVDYTIIKDAILGTLYGPALWGQLAVGLASLASGTGNVTEAVLEFVQQYAGELDLDSAAETTSAIKCGDKAVRASSTGAAGLNSVRPVVERLENQSRVGGDKLSWFVPRCAQWQLDAKERYDGDFNVQTKNPVLVIGNTFDPVAPLVSARNLSETLSGSVLLQHDGFGVSNFRGSKDKLPLMNNADLFVRSIPRLASPRLAPRKRSRASLLTAPCLNRAPYAR